MNYELQPGDTATMKQEDGGTLSVRVYGHFALVKAERPGTMLQTDMDSDFIMAVKVVERKEVKQIRVHATDEVVEFMKSRFPDRVGNAEVMNFGQNAVLGVKIDISDLTHSELMGVGMSYPEAVHLLGK